VRGAHQARRDRRQRGHALLNRHQVPGEGSAGVLLQLFAQPYERRSRHRGFQPAGRGHRQGLHQEGCQEWSFQDISCCMIVFFKCIFY